MRTRRLIHAASLLAAAALLAAGCGGGGGSDEPTAADAQAAYKPIRAEIRGLGNDIGVAITDATRETDAQLADAFDRLAARGRSTVARLQRLDVPSDLDADRLALRAALQSGTGDLSDIAAAASRSDAAAARSAVQKLIDVSRAVAAARGSFETALGAARD